MIASQEDKSDGSCRLQLNSIMESLRITVSLLYNVSLCDSYYFDVKCVKYSSSQSIVWMSTYAVKL